MSFQLSTYYQAWVQRLRLPWLGIKGRAIMGAFAAIIGDKTIDWMTQAQLEHLPEYASPPSVSLIASERQLDAGPAETTSALATRLTRAVQQWQLAGTAIGMLIQLYYAGFPGAVIVQQNGLAYYLSAPPSLADLATLATTQPSWYQVVSVGATPVSVPGPGGMTPGLAWWSFDLQFALCSRFAVLFPGPQYPSSMTTHATAIFNGTTDAVSVSWNNAFPDTTYKVIAGPPTITDGNGGVLVDVDGTTKTTAGITVRASVPFTGQVDLIAYQSGSNPFVVFDPNDLARLRRVIGKWRPAKALCEGIHCVAQGQMIGWPVRTLGSGIMGSSTVVTYSP